ncbi:recombinase family protein [Allosaccharopolyspora coralli]|uniref:recombinase family protein n=1 Tax=Allosaccharopolyspora coralli TaxID=2665642 RepID=UPI001C9E94CE|nr:recombinase family protein [Allosaccharopolyspora coralli]
MRIGYGRVSTRDQHPEAQHDVLTAAGCDEVFVDKASGTLARRPELEKALLAANRTGDQLVVTKLDRLGRSLEHLIELSNQLQAKHVDLVVLNGVAVAGAEKTTVSSGALGAGRIQRVREPGWR